MTNGGIILCNGPYIIDHGRCIFSSWVCKTAVLGMRAKNLHSCSSRCFPVQLEGRTSNLELLLHQETEPAARVSREGKSPADDSGSRASASASSTVFKNSKRILSRAAVGISSMSLRFKSGSKTHEIPALL